MSAVSDIKAKIDLLKSSYRSAQSLACPVGADYSEPAAIDAYTINYLPRNTLVGRMVLLCRSYHPSFQKLPSKLRVLDLGSGTGGVVLGLLDLFKTASLSKTQLEIISVDSSRESLQRQDQLVTKLDPGSSTVTCIQVNLSNPSSYETYLENHAPYDMVFAANVLTELEKGSIDNLVGCAGPLISGNGILAIVEAERDYTKTLMGKVAKDTLKQGLSIYYPCPPASRCGKSHCWSWRNDEFESADIRVHGKSFSPTNVQKASWMILCRARASIYDVLHAEKPGLIWGVASPYSGTPDIENDRATFKYEFCTERGRWEKSVAMGRREYLRAGEKEPIARGAIVGFEPDLDRIAGAWDIVSGFRPLPGNSVELM